MALPDAVSTVTVGGRVLHPITGVPLTGVMRVEVPALAVNDGSLIGGGAESFPFVEGAFVAPPVLPATDSPNVVPTGWSARVTIQTDSDWNPVFLCPLPAAQPSTTLSIMYAQQVVTPPPTASYVPLNLLGAANGVATLGSDGILTPDQRPPSGASVRPWQIAEQYAGLSDPSAITNYAADPNAGITLAAGTYRDLRFTCTELILPNSNTKLVNCDIVTSNSSYGVRLDANTGMETGRYLEHCRITAGGVALAGAGFTARLCEVVNNSDDSARLGRSHAEPTVLEFCHFHSYRPQAGAHADGIQIVTPPAADVVVYGCSITMDTAVGYSMPDGAGYTAALFVDTADVPVDGGDLEPTRIGSIWADGCKLYSSDNYSVVIDGPNVDVRNCTLLPGSTAVESINDGAVVTGTGNVDSDGVPIADTDIHGDPRSRYLTVDDPRQSGGGGGGFAPVRVTSGPQTGTFGPGGTGPDSPPQTQTPPEWQLTLPPSKVAAGHLVQWSMPVISTGGDAQCDVASIVDGEPVNYYSDNYGPDQADDGHSGLYMSGDFGHVQGPTIWWVVQDADLASDGSLTLSFLYFAGGAHVWGSSTLPGQVDMVNFGPQG